MSFIRPSAGTSRWLITLSFKKTKARRYSCWELRSDSHEARTKHEIKETSNKHMFQCEVDKSPLRIPCDFQTTDRKWLNGDPKWWIPCWWAYQLFLTNSSLTPMHSVFELLMSTWEMIFPFALHLHEKKQERWWTLSCVGTANYVFFNHQLEWSPEERSNDWIHQNSHNPLIFWSFFCLINW